MRQSKLITKAVAVFVAAFGLAVGASAMTPAKGPQKLLDTVSKEGGSAMQDVRWARVAIFDGQPKQAEKILEQAKKDLTTVEKQAPKMVVTVNTKEQLGDKTVDAEKTTQATDLIPIDAALTLSEDFTATPEKTKQIAKANEHLKKGETSKAVEVLHEADIGVGVTRTLMPVKSTSTHVDKAIELLKDHKYYEANLALKAAEDGQVVDTVLLYEPDQAAAAHKKASEPETKK
jgi:hypothetical protein